MSCFPEGYTYGYKMPQGTWFCRESEAPDRCVFQKNGHTKPLQKSAALRDSRLTGGNPDEDDGDLGSIDPSYIPRSECTTNSDCNASKPCLKLAESNDGGLSYSLSNPKKLKDKSQVRCNPSTAKCSVFGFCTDDSKPDWLLDDKQNVTQCSSDTECNQWWKTCVEFFDEQDPNTGRPTGKKLERMVACQSEGRCDVSGASSEKRCLLGRRPEPKIDIKAKLKELLMQRFAMTDANATAAVTLFFNTMTSRGGLVRDGKYVQSGQDISAGDKASMTNGSAQVSSNGTGRFFQNRLNDYRSS